MIVHDGIPGKVKKPIEIGNHTWLCSETHLLKGAGLGDDCVLGYGSILTKEIAENNVLAAGIPAKVIKEHIEWVHG